MATASSAQTGRAAGQLHVGPAAAPGSHLPDPLQRFGRADEHCRRVPLAPGDDVEAVVHPVDEVDVRMGGRTYSCMGVLYNQMLPYSSGLR
jgi:hypothetical protein